MTSGFRADLDAVRVAHVVEGDRRARLDLVRVFLARDLVDEHEVRVRAGDVDVQDFDYALCVEACGQSRRQ